MATIESDFESICINPNDDLVLYKKEIVRSRIEKFLYAICSLDNDDLPTPLSRIEEMYKCLVMGVDFITFTPLSRAEKFVMAMLGAYDVELLPTPISRSETLMKKIATGDNNLDDVDNLQSRYEFLLAYIIKAGGFNEGSFVDYSLDNSWTTLYNTLEYPVKSAILKGSTKYHDIDTGEILDTFDETKNLELVSVKMPVLKTTGKNLFNKNNIIVDGYIISNGNLVYETGDNRNASDFIEVEPNCLYRISGIKNSAINGARSHQYIGMYDKNKRFISSTTIYCLSDSATFTTTENTKYIRASVRNDDINRLQIEKGTNTTYEPYKSNILMCNEEVELRGIGDIKDELNLVTGKLTQRIQERVFDGSENWIIGGTGTNYIMFRCENYTDMVKSSSAITCDKYAYTKLNNATSNLSVTNSTTTGKICIVTSQTDLSIDNFKAKLNTDKPTIQYQLAEPIVKTVDLSILDQDGKETKLNTFDDITHVTVSSEGLVPTGEITVETKNATDVADASVMSLRMDDILNSQRTLEGSANAQSDDIDIAMLGTTDIYEQLL